MNRVIYDSDQGRTCPKCNRPVTGCKCAWKSKSAPAGDGVVRVRREVRRGKDQTVVEGIPLGAAELAAFAKQLKKRLGVGGTAKNGVLELQGDHRDAVVAAASDRGWTVKRAGG